MCHFMLYLYGGALSQLGGDLLYHYHCFGKSPSILLYFCDSSLKKLISFFVPRHRGCFDKISLDLPPFFYVFDPPFAKWPPCPSVFYVEFDRYQPIRTKNFRRRRRWLALRRPCFSLVSTGFCFQGFFSQCFALKIHSDFAAQDVKWGGFCHLFGRLAIADPIADRVLGLVSFSSIGSKPNFIKLAPNVGPMDATG